MSSKFRFKTQDYQTDAVNAVVGTFSGQPFVDRSKYTRDLGSGKVRGVDLVAASHNATMGEENIFDVSDIGFANSELVLDDEQLLVNINTVQSRYSVNYMSKDLARDKDTIGKLALDVEMETGTGKTYCYIKTMFELNKCYGWSKFIVVVPSVAIREGVRSSLEQMEDHFMDTYGKKASFFVYNSDNLTRLDEFAMYNTIQVMIINYQAFNSRKSTNIIDTATEVFQDRKPIDVIRATRPILILDEPQKLGGEATLAGLKKFGALFAINYSATHLRRNNLVYQLDAIDAYNKFLVKKIEVKGFEIDNLGGTDKYLYLQDIIISEQAPKVRLEYERRLKSGTIKRVTSILGKGDDLFDKSGEMEQYRDRYVIEDIDARAGVGELIFLNGERLRIKEVRGFKQESDMRRVQIRETIVSHLDKEAEFLYKRKIKCLSLFFIDEVAKYRTYTENDEEQGGEYAKIFEEEYRDEVQRRLDDLATPLEYKEYLHKMEASAVHNGYFSKDKKGKSINSDVKSGREFSDDISAYDLILKNKERLLSYDEPTRFIFSHSALREGWDNPNVFQICTLKHSDSKISKRQEIGRGLRICRDSVSYTLQDKQYLKSDTAFHRINKLTVIATESYKDFVTAFQSELVTIAKGKPAHANEHYFEGKLLCDKDNKPICDKDNKPIKVSKTQAKKIYQYLVRHDYIDDKDHVTDRYSGDSSDNVLKPLPQDLQDYDTSIHRLIQGVYDPKTLVDMIDNVSMRKNVVKPNKNFDKAEFRALWNEINHKYAYQVDFDSTQLIDKVVNAINEKLHVNKLQYTVTHAEQRTEIEVEQLKKNDIFQGQRTSTHNLNKAVSDIPYDIVGKLAVETTLTRLTIATILSKIDKSKFDMFVSNPEEFISKVDKLIQEQKATMLVDHIVYNRIDGKYDNDIFTVQKTNVELERAQTTTKNILDKIFTDSHTESELAKAMDAAEEVVVYAKLPRNFQIPTPVGDYSPDWAIAFDDSKGIKHIYFVAETKGNLSSLQLRPLEQAKIKCAKSLFGNLGSSKVKYDTIVDYKQLLELVRS